MVVGTQPEARSTFDIMMANFTTGLSLSLLNYSTHTIMAVAFVVFPAATNPTYHCPKAGVKKGGDAGGLLKGIPAHAGDAIIFTETLVHGTLPWQPNAPRQTVFFTNSLLTVQVGQPTILILLTSHNMQTSPIGNLHCSSLLTPDTWGEKQDHRSKLNPINPNRLCIQ